nr:hypothetical protein CFP56_13673 [Quercus suber]
MDAKLSVYSGIPPFFFVSTEELYSILKAWMKDGMVVLPKCKHEPTEEEKQGALYCWYHKRSDNHTMDCYALKNTFHEKVAKVDLVIKNRKCTDQRMHRPKVATTFFTGCDDPMEEEAENMVSSNVALAPLLGRDDAANSTR